ncbi:MAG TPA: OmpA family protein [Kofleriaceae bacterium]|nr:OmpA family protein [Kofleriaceae bacterium]
MTTNAAARWAGVLALCAGACVSKGKHEATTARLKDAEAESAALRRERDRLQGELEAARLVMEGKLAATQEELEELRVQREAQKAQLELFRKFTDKLQSMIAVGDIDVYMRRGRMVVGMPSQVLFPSGQHELSEKGKGTLRRVAGALKEFPDRRFLVAGHTDTKPIGEKLKTLYEDNWDLSARRALVVTRFLIAEGVAPGSLAAAGYGEHDPARSNKGAGGRAKNRRIELIVEPLLAELPKLPTELKKDGEGDGKKEEAPAAPAKKKEEAAPK